MRRSPRRPRSGLPLSSAGKTKLSEIGADDLGAALDALLPWNLKRRLEEEAPTHFEAPTGNRHAIDYETAGAPALHIRVQELFGLTQHPSIANGKLPLTLHLLSPAHRPIQITRDLPGFWKGSWAAVKAEMKGRYPRHPWPDDPASCAIPEPRGAQPPLFRSISPLQGSGCDAAAVIAALKRRYPRPSPMSSAAPTARAKPRGT